MSPFPSSRRLGLVGLAAALFLCLHQPSGAAVNVDAAESSVRNMAEKTVAILTSTEPGSAPREARLREVLQDNLNLPYLAQLAAGAGWRGASPAEKQRFLRVFSDWVLNTQARRLGQYAGERFDVTGGEAVSEADAIVRTQISGGRLEAPVDAQWRMRQTGGRYQIVDVVIAGVSLVVTYRNEFQPIIQRGGVGALAAELENRARSAGA